MTDGKNCLFTYLLGILNADAYNVFKLIYTFKKIRSNKIITKLRKTYNENLLI